MMKVATFREDWFNRPVTEIMEVIAERIEQDLGDLEVISINSSLSRPGNFIYVIVWYKD